MNIDPSKYADQTTIAKLVITVDGNSAEVMVGSFADSASAMRSASVAHDEAERQLEAAGLGEVSHVSSTCHPAPQNTEERIADLVALLSWERDRAAQERAEVASPQSILRLI